MMNVLSACDGSPAGRSELVDDVGEALKLFGRRRELVCVVVASCRQSAPREGDSRSQRPCSGGTEVISVPSTISRADVASEARVEVEGQRDELCPPAHLLHFGDCSGPVLVERILEGLANEERSGQKPRCSELPIGLGRELAGSRAERARIHRSAATAWAS